MTLNYVDLVGDTAGSVNEGGTYTTTSDPMVINQGDWAKSHALAYSISQAPSVGTLTIDFVKNYRHGTSYLTYGTPGGSFSWSYTIDPDDPELDSLDAGQSMTVTFKVRVFVDTPYYPSVNTNYPTYFINGGIHTVTITIFGADESAVCFMAGSLISTEIGDRPIEELKVGDLVQTRDHGMQPIRWLGHSKVHKHMLAGNSKLYPVKISANAIAEGCPMRDLWVSPQHRILIRDWQNEILFGQDEVFTLAKDMVNGDTITFDHSKTDFEYWHVLFDNHEVIYADGAPAESLFLGKNAIEGISFDQVEEIETLFPGFIEKNASDNPIAEMQILQSEMRVRAHITRN